MQSITQLVTHQVRQGADFVRFIGLALRIQFTRLPPRDVLVTQLVDAGWGSLALLTVLTLFAGLNLSVQSYGSFERFGGQDLLGMFAGVGGVRELYPVMAAVVCGARIGANLAASLANMRISEQIEALEVMAVDPVHYLVAPRLWAVTLALPLLCGYADVIGLAASYAGAVWQLGLDPGSFISQVQDAVRLADIGTGLLKGLIMGWLVAVISCFHGYTVAKRDGAEGVGIATNLAIVHGAVMCIVVNLILSWLIYG
ncbi:ABC-type transport system involved in resistance to organic solvents, permease component [Enhygromyxa salina]|uniref:ABC-type transport system involved in resistance to organic solvents, permease component n=1 Tax=Enhygromyxa salina TaxID=215803 RepID=A0A0C1ZLZ4_9BACT|nr:ABC transporter permease [Enhygromyxa salina]KIG11868.1 ABC-type transport system involved in resistance to organic solvents, permease component [Enhygromyxa salina]